MNPPRKSLGPSQKRQAQAQKQAEEDEVDELDSSQEPFPQVDQVINKTVKQSKAVSSSHSSISSSRSSHEKAHRSFSSPSFFSELRLLPPLALLLLLLLLLSFHPPSPLHPEFLSDPRHPLNQKRTLLLLPLLQQTNPSTSTMLLHLQLPPKPSLSSASRSSHPESSLSPHSTRSRNSSRV